MGAKVIAMFNHKGGVSKTTTTFNLGWTLAEMGFKVLIVDTDPQCNLTAYVLGLGNATQMDSFYESKKNDDIYSAMQPIIDGDGQVKRVGFSETKHKNLYLVAGHTSMAELDVALAFGMGASDVVKFASQFIGAFNAIIRETAKQDKFDIVLVDMSPSASALNRCVLMGSDYFLVPTSPDFFCYQAIQSLARMLPKWHHDLMPFRNQKIKNPLPENPPKFLGIISQKYRPHTKNDSGKDKAVSFQKWIDRIQEVSKETLVGELRKITRDGNKDVSMSITEEEFRNCVDSNEEKPYNIISIPDFNSLIAISQDHSKPVFTLTTEELKKRGMVLETMQKNQEIFKAKFFQLASSVCKMIGISKDETITDRQVFNEAIERASKSLQ